MCPSPSLFPPFPPFPYQESFNIIYPLQVGLLYDSLNFQFPVKDGSGAIKVYTAGRRFTGVGFRFVKFPTTWNTVTFAGNKSEGASTCAPPFCPACACALLRASTGALSVHRLTHTVNLSPLSFVPLSYDLHWCFFVSFFFRPSVLLPRFSPSMFVRCHSSFLPFLPFPCTPVHTKDDRQRLFGRTRDGLRVMIEGSFQYKLHVDEPDAMAMLFTSFGEPFEDGGEEGNEPVRPYEDAFMRFAGDQVRNVASGYDSFDFFSNRTMITNAMEAGIQHRISTELGVDCKAFQLLSVDLPDEFDTALENTEVARQAIVQAGYQRKTASIQAYTAVIEATNDAEVIRLEARAKAKAYVLQVAAELLALDFRVSKEMSAYKYVQDQLG